MFKKILFISMSLVIFGSSCFAETLVFGIVPQQSPNKLFRTWKPFIDYLSKSTNIEIIFRTEKSIPAFEKKLYNGEYDIAYSNPYHYTIANKTQKHMALVRFDKEIVGILVVNKKSKINSINGIKNKEFLFPAPKAFAATILTKYDVLNKQKYDIEKSNKFKYVNSHDSVYLGIQRGIGEVGGGIKRTFNRFKNKDELKVIYTTDKYPSHPISISSKVDSKLIQKIEDALLKMPKEFIEPINKKALVRTNNDEYNIVKKLAFELGIFPE